MWGLISWAALKRLFGQRETVSLPLVAVNVFTFVILLLFEIMRKQREDVICDRFCGCGNHGIKKEHRWPVLLPRAGADVS